jgi:ligand-binding sensor domain-containing protein
MTPFDNTPWGRSVIRDILQTSNHDVWVATAIGLIQIRPDQSWRFYGRNDGLPSEYITSVFEDRSGQLWIGTDQGFARLDINNTIDVFTISADLSNMLVNDIQPAFDGSAFIISNSSLVSRIDLYQAMQTIDPGTPLRFSHFIIMGSDTLVATDKGYYALNNHSMQLWQTIPYVTSSLSLEMENGDLLVKSPSHLQQEVSRIPQ